MTKARDIKRKSIPIPTTLDWGEIRKEDLDLVASYNDYFGKSCLEIRRKFSTIPISMIDSLRWLPLRPFVFYFRCLAEFVLDCPLNLSATPDLENSFLNLVAEKARTCPAGMRANMDAVRKAVAYVSENQRKFDASPEIYGDFSLKGAEIFRALDKI